MDDTLIFSLLIIVAFVGVFFGLSMIITSGIQSVSGMLGASHGGGLLASAAAAFEGTVPQNGMFLVSYDTFANVHAATLETHTPVRIFDMAQHGIASERTIYAATDQGMFFSYDSGLTWHQFTSSNNEITPTAAVLRIVQTGTNAYIISVFQDGVGTVYQTTDNFFTLTSLLDFKNEAAYDMVATPSRLYIGLSNGQVLSYSWKTHTTEVIYVFKSPVARMMRRGNGWYILLKSGAFIKGDALTGPFTHIIVPGGGIFAASASIIHTAFDSSGMVYVQTAEGIWRSTDGGSTFALLKHIPLLTNHIDAFDVYGSTVYVYADGRLLTSVDGGTTWAMKDVASNFSPTRFFFEGGGLVLLTY